MNFKDRFLVLAIIVIFMSVLGLAYASNHENITDGIVIVNNTDDNPLFGCCSIVFQLDGNDTLMSYRRDSNVTADVHIEKVIWHGIPAIKHCWPSKPDSLWAPTPIARPPGWED